MLPDEVSKEFLIHTGLVNNLIHGMSDYPGILIQSPWLTAVSQNVHPSSIAFRRTGSASSRLRLLPKPKLRPIAPKPGDGTWVSLKGSVLVILFNR